MGERQTILIAGAGIGGLTAALALSGTGWRVVIVERTAELSEAGAGIQLAPNAGAVLDSLGLNAKVSARAIEPSAIEVRRGSDGRVLASVPGRAFRERYDVPYRVIHRADLQAILLDAVRADPLIRLEPGATVAGQLANDDGLLVRIRRPEGSEVVPAAALIGADGVWSATRALVAGAGSPTLSGRTAWRAALPADTARDLLSMDRIGLWLGPDAHLVHYPVAGGTAVNIVAIIAESWTKPGWSAVGAPAEIVWRFKGWTSAARAIVGAPLAWHKHAIATVSPDASWTAGRVALLGDAAHAMVPFMAQGAAMAMEDAAALADCLYGAKDIPAALLAYETARKGRVARVAAASADTGRRYHERGFVASARDIALRLAGARLILGRNDWIYRWRRTGGLAQPMSKESSSIT